MKTSDLMKMGLRSLTRRKARTILTVLGVVIGCLFIIIMQSVGKAMDHNFEKQVEEYGTLTTISVYGQGEIVDDNGNWIGSKEQELNDALVEKLSALDHVKVATPVIQKHVTLYSGKLQGWASITAMDMNTFDAFEFPNLTLGQYPTEEDNSVIIFGSGMPDQFYDTSAWRWTPVPIDIEKDKLVLKFDGYETNERKKEFSLPLNNIARLEETRTEFDYSTYMDLDYFKEIYMKYCNSLTLQNRKKALEEISKYQEIKINVDNINNVISVQDKIKEMGYQSNSMMQYFMPMKEASETLQLILSCLAAVSMFVSAISIANTMVMSIYERTKEIGVMKVLGCVIRDIRKLFLFEAGMIGLFGGLIGVGLSYLASFLINEYGEPLFGALVSGNTFGTMQETSAFSIITPDLPLIAMGISIGVGLLSGYFPARRATKIRAIEAMKSEG